MNLVNLAFHEKKAFRQQDGAHRRTFSTEQIDDAEIPSSGSLRSEQKNSIRSFDRH